MRLCTRLIKSLLTIIILLILMVGCFTKEYKFEVNNDLIILDQSEEGFSIRLLDDYVSLAYGEKDLSLAEVEIEVEGNVDLSKIGNYDIKLNVENKSGVENVDLTISVIDRTAPTLYIFEDQLLVNIDEEIDISSKHFFINMIDGINGQLNNRITVDKSYDLNKVGTYPVLLVGKDESGNEVSEEISVRVTDIIDEKALYLYNKAKLAAEGEAFVFRNNDLNNEIINLQDTLAIFTPNYSRHFMWISGVTGDYNPKQSGVKLEVIEDKYYADFSHYESLEGYKNTTLELKYEDETTRIYTAQSTYGNNGAEETKLAKFSIKKIDGAWLVDEFYLQYN